MDIALLDEAQYEHVDDGTESVKVAIDKIYAFATSMVEYGQKYPGEDIIKDALWHATLRRARFMKESDPNHEVTT